MAPNGTAEPREVAADFWSKLHQDYPEFRGHVLIANFEVSKDWSSWERHPEGDEYVYLLSGAVTMVLDTDAGEQAIPLSSPGQFALIPRGTWHTARAQEPGRMLFVTPGHGTEHRAN